MNLYEISIEEQSVSKGGKTTTQKVLLGRATGKDFKDACKKFASMSVEFKYCFNAETMTFNGCKLLENVISKTDATREVRN